MGELMLKKPLEERLYFENLEPDWLRLVIDRGLPAGWWEVEGKRLVPTGAIRETFGGRYAESAFFRFTVYLREVWDEEAHAQIWVPRQNDYGEVVDMGEPVMMFDAEREPSRWLVSAVCYFEYAMETFNRLVEQLRAAGGVEPRPVEALGDAPQPKATKKKRRGGSYAYPPDQQRELADEYRRLRANGKVRGQDAFAALKGISDRTLRKYLRDNPEKAETES